MIRDQIKNDLITAMKARDSRKVQALRFLESAIKQVEVDQRKELSDQDVIKILRSELKKRQESVAIYTKAGRDDLRDNEQFEVDLINSYLPQQMVEAEIEKIVNEVLASLGENHNFGQVMQEVMKKTAGQADGKMVSQVVKQKLS